MQRPRRLRSAVVVAVAVLVAVASPGGGRVARADVEETELRLKTAGVPAELRKRIHAAITRGAAFLVARQKESGAFHYPGADGGGFTSGTTALASLALAHSGGPAADDAARKGLAYLTPDDERAVQSAVTQTYSAGLTAMLLQALRTRPGIAARIVRNLTRSLDAGSGWWGYGPEGLSGDRGPFGAATVRDIVNLSTTQYGALGLWAGSRASGQTALAAWRLHLRGICAWQARDGSWEYGPRQGSQGYPNGTFMGLASLVLARTALAVDLEDDPVLAAQSAVALRAALRALDRDGPAALRSGHVDFYGYYALEKACVFADVARTGRVDWYVAGAENLLAEQLENGGWGGTQTFQAGVGMQTRRTVGDCVSTGFALLFLLRASETFHPTTPRGVNAPGPTTPGAQSRAADEAGPAPVLPPPPRAVLLADAIAALEQLARSVDRSDRAAEALAAIEVIAAGFRSLDPGAPAPDAAPDALLAAETAFLDAATAWRDRAGRALVDALRADSAGVALAAANALARGPQSASGELRTRIDRVLRYESGRATRPFIEAVFRAVGELGDPRSLVWLVSHVTTDRKPADVRAARAALRSLARWSGGTAIERRAAAVRVAKALDDLERSAAKADPDGPISWTAAEHWKQLGPPALAALEALCRDPDAPDGAAPWEDGEVPTTVAGFAGWLDTRRKK